MTSNELKEIASKKGRDAFHSGLERSQNPYFRRQYDIGRWRAWNAGWVEESRMARKAKSKAMKGGPTK